MASFAANTPSSSAATTLEVACYARDLPNMDRASKVSLPNPLPPSSDGHLTSPGTYLQIQTDPFCVVTLCKHEEGVTCDEAGHVTMGGLLVLKELDNKHLSGEE
jgi:hypothetical protein